MDIIKKINKLLPETSTVGGSYTGSASNIASTGQTRIRGNGPNKDIDVLRRKPRPLRYNSLLGAYLPPDEEEGEEWT